jgi:hypothetical protein
MWGVSKKTERNSLKRQFNVSCEHPIRNKVEKKPPGTPAVFFDATL